MYIIDLRSIHIAVTKRNFKNSFDILFAAISCLSEILWILMDPKEIQVSYITTRNYFLFQIIEILFLTLADIFFVT